MTASLTDWTSKKCRACSEASVKVFNENEILKQLQDFKGWEFAGGNIVKTFKFENYYQTTAFVNAVVWIAHHEDHHPEIYFDYKSCQVKYRTHKKSGITENDFICAAKVEQLLN